MFKRILFSMLVATIPSWLTATLAGVHEDEVQAEARAVFVGEDGKVITEESEDAWKMSMDDHSKSLEYIGKIKSDSPIEKD